MYLLCICLYSANEVLLLTTTIFDNFYECTAPSFLLFFLVPPPFPSFIILTHPMATHG